VFSGKVFEKWPGAAQEKQWVLVRGHLTWHGCVQIDGYVTTVEKPRKDKLYLNTTRNMANV